MGLGEVEPESCVGVPITSKVKRLKEVKAPRTPGGQSKREPVQEIEGCKECELACTGDNAKPDIRARVKSQSEQLNVQSQATHGTRMISATYACLLGMR